MRNINYLDNCNETDNEIITDSVNYLYAVAVLDNNIHAIARLNLFVREKNIDINRINVIKHIYYEICSREYEYFLKRGARVEHYSFTDRMKDMYIHRYWHIFKMFDIPTYYSD